MSTNILVHVANKLQEEMDIISDDLDLGHAKDFGDYKFHTGRIRGLLTAKNILMEVSEQLEREND